MKEIRPFLNSDAVDIARLWNDQPPLAGRLGRVTAAMLETHVFSKDYFDPAGFLVAVGESRLEGVALASFAPNEGGQRLDRSWGIVALVLHPSAPCDVLNQLWQAVVDYYRRHGTARVSIGSRFPDTPFLAGFYGGTFVPGVLDEDHPFLERLIALGFEPGESIDVLSLTKESFKSAVERRLILAKRQFEIKWINDPLPRSYWEFAQGTFRQQLDFHLIEKRSDIQAGILSAWSIIPMDTGWDPIQLGFAQVQVAEPFRSQGLGLLLATETVKEIFRRGTVRIEAQVPHSNQTCRELLEKIGFRRQFRANQLSRTV